MDPTCGLADKFRDLVLDQIWEQFLYLVCYCQNIEQLTEQLVELTLERKLIQHRIDEARNNVEQIEDKVLHWLDEVDKIFKQVEQLHKDSQAKRGCSITSCSNPWLRYKLSKSAKEMVQKVSDICEKGKFDRVSYPVPPPKPQLGLPDGESNEGIDSRVLIMNQIMEALQSQSINMIGLCGPGGVGKTTITKEVAKNQNKFEKVIMATVSDDLSIERIQGRIAEKLGMQLNEIDIEIGWIYGSVTEDILTGFKMQCRGWRSIYCVPMRPAFKGSAPINLSDRLHQVLCWALGLVEIFLSRHCPLWYGYGGGRLKGLQRLAYINTIVYPFTSLPLIAYCCLPAICLLTGKFIIPTLSNIASVLFLGLFLSIIVTSVLELCWSGVGIEYLWRNEQFWVIGGVSAHLFAVFQGFLKMLAGVDTNFTVTDKAADDTEFGELYMIKWTTLLIPPTTLIVINIVGVVAGFSDALNGGYESWGPLFGKVFFAFWVIFHLYPFLKGPWVDKIGHQLLLYFGQFFLPLFSLFYGSR